MFLKTFMFFCFSIICVVANAQNNKVVDSLLQVIHRKSVADTTLVKAFNDLGVQHAISKPLLAKDYIMKALAISEQNNNSIGIAGSYNSLGKVYLYQNEYDTALKYFEKALQINKKSNHIWGQASALHQIAATHVYSGNYLEGITVLEQSGALFLKKNDSLSYAKSLQTLGVAYKGLGQLSVATKKYLASIKIYQELNITTGITHSKYQLGDILSIKKEYRKALPYLNSSLSGFQEMGNFKFILINHQNLGWCYKELKDYDNAIKHYEKALEIYKNKYSISNSSYVLSMLSEIYYDLDQLDKATYYQKKAVQELNSNKKMYKLGKAYTYISMGTLFLKQKKTDSAVFYAQKALKYTHKNSFLRAKMDTYHLLALAAEEKNNNIVALEYFKKLAILKDSIQELENKTLVYELSAQYESNEKDLKIKQFEKTTKTKQKQIGVLIILGLVCIAFLLVGGKILRKKNKQKRKLEEMVKRKNKELTANTLHLLRKNNTLNNVKEKLTNLCNTPGENVYPYRKVLQVINFDEKEDQNWELFRELFEETHHGFYKKINDRFPSITSKELRLICLLRLNLSSKEISKFLNISPEGVKKARYRLRKKMNLTTKESLEDYIINI
ncbi:tetratricopeptide repeat protein [Aquimarina sp. AD10]|uniref:tetratricopeptide repeat protein n=2 Tax=Aquimarina sp. AD10 TaxID=1714849 RepID=UPI000E47CFE7|nr:tetratricopeptide repeat protein [Aquimarina sp. AD10]AXT62648.1 tetratricopeptide repeat protein [Aquimarina sp. AD10]RKM98356.1 tetratricopeptide repeat protein [Aquimarina sp. AD10]